MERPWSQKYCRQIADKEKEISSPRMATTSQESIAVFTFQAYSVGGASMDGTETGLIDQAQFGYCSGGPHCLDK